MNKKRFVNSIFKTVLILFFCFIGFLNFGQSFQNGDLEGIIAVSSVPLGWEQVPFGDPVSNASSTNQATSDLTGLFGPELSFGINGNPHSGNTFTSGLHTEYELGGYLYREGIMQNVDGLIPGEFYQISFYQSVVKQSQALDESGSWSVFIDTILLGVTNPSYSEEPFNSITIPWEFRTINFQATNSSHLIKFLPTDDDTIIDIQTNNGVRMGIDSVSLTMVQSVPQINIGSDTTICEGESLTLNANCVGCSYLWQNGSTTSNLEVNQGGIYWVEVTNSNGTFKDSININFFIIDDVDFPNVITVNNDGINDLLNIETYFETCQEFKFSIFDRWGILVYEYLIGGQPFIGKSMNSDELKDGVYFYRLSIKDNIKNGYIHIIH